MLSASTTLATASGAKWCAMCPKPGSHVNSLWPESISGHLLQTVRRILKTRKPAEHILAGVRCHDEHKRPWKAYLKSSEGKTECPEFLLKISIGFVENSFQSQSFGALDIFFHIIDKDSLRRFSFCPF